MYKLFENQKVYSLRDASELLGISTETLTDHIFNRKISAGLIDGEIYISEEVIKRLKKSAPDTGNKTRANDKNATGEKRRIIEVR